jgi:hypothetical protein
MAHDNRPRIRNARPNPHQAGITGYGLSHVEQYSPGVPSGVSRLGANRGRQNHPGAAWWVQDETDAKNKIRRALPRHWDGPVIDHAPTERIEAIHLIRGSNIKPAQRLSELENARLRPGTLVRAKVCETTTNMNHNVEDYGVTSTVYGLMIVKARYHILLRKYTKHGVFAPVTTRQAKGLKDLSEEERLTRIGFRKEGERFDRDSLTEEDHEFLSLHDPLELKEGVLNPGSFVDLSYPTSLYWSSDIVWEGCLTDSNTRRALEVYWNIYSIGPKHVNEIESSDKTSADEARITADPRPEAEPLQQMQDLAENAYFDGSTPDEQTSDHDDDPDRPKQTVEQIAAAYSSRWWTVTSALCYQKGTEEELFQEADEITLLEAEAQNKARRAQFAYLEAISVGTARDFVMQLSKETAEKAVADFNLLKRKKDAIVALAEDVLSNRDLRPRVAAGQDVDRERTTLINNATKSLKDRMDSIARQM